MASKKSSTALTVVKKKSRFETSAFDTHVEILLPKNLSKEEEAVFYSVQSYVASSDALTRSEDECIGHVML